MKSHFAPNAPTRIAAAINVSPESFYAGSVAADSESLATAVRAAESEGALLIDVGAMSTAPYRDAHVSEDEEVRRMGLAVAAARSVRTCQEVLISADTQRAKVAEAALNAGAAIINDVSALADPAMGDLIASRGAGLILMANDSPSLDEAGQTPITIVMNLLSEAIARALKAGVPRSLIMIDPGVGFFRHRSLPWHEWDMEVLRHLGRLKRYGLPIFLGVSRKSFIGHHLQRPAAGERLAGSLAIAVYAANAGVEWLRVHDVRETADVLRMTALLHAKD